MTLGLLRSGGLAGCLRLLGVLRPWLPLGQHCWPAWSSVPVRWRGWILWGFLHSLLLPRAAHWLHHKVRFSQRAVGPRRSGSARLDEEVSLEGTLRR